MKWALGDTIYFHFASNDTGGSGDDGATPVFDVREAGAAASAAPVLSGSATLLTHANYPAGCHEVAIAATAGNGFAAGKHYAVFSTLLVDSENPTGWLGTFYLTAAGENPLTNAIIAAYIDDILSGVHGSGSWEDAGTGSGGNVVTLNMKDDSGDPVPGVRVVVRNVTETTLVAVGITDADGDAELNLDEGTYKVRYGPAYAAGGPEGRGLGGGYWFDGNPYTLTVSGATTQDFTCDAIATANAGLTYGDLKSMVHQAVLRTWPQWERLIPQAFVEKWVNSAYQELDRKLRHSRTNVTFTTTAGTEEYALSSVVREVEAVVWADASDGDRQTELDGLSLSEWLKKKHDSTDSGNPEYYLQHGDVLYLYPPPDTTSDTIYVWGVMEPTNLSGDEEMPGFAANLHILIVDLAVAYAAQHVGDLAIAQSLRRNLYEVLHAERYEPQVKRTGPDRMINDGI